MKVICKNIPELESYVGLTPNKKYNAKEHSNDCFLKVTNDYKRTETYPKSLFEDAPKECYNRYMKVDEPGFIKGMHVAIDIETKEIIGNGFDSGNLNTKMVKLGYKINFTRCHTEDSKFIRNPELYGYTKKQTRRK